VRNDGFEAVRRGLAARFRASEPGSRRGAWESSRPLRGSWEAVAPAPPRDVLEEGEDDRERARRLLGRYGVLFRELCAQEMPALRWARVARALRLLELSGEVFQGHFVEGIPGMQFALPDALLRLEAARGDGPAWWANAADPASLCGLGLVEGLPPRLPTTWLAYRGHRLLMVAYRDGRRLEFREEPDASVLDLFAGRRTVVEEIDGEPAARSPRAPLLSRHGFERDMDRLVRFPGGEP
jgi:ATP-dependent Lhr-like helicase